MGRLPFDNAEDYDHYARSIIAYETAGSVPNVTRDRLLGHAPSERPATNLSATLLIDPLANGLADGGLLKTPINADLK